MTISQPTKLSNTVISFAPLIEIGDHVGFQKETKDASQCVWIQVMRLCLVS